jgi:hypothetical protein
LTEFRALCSDLVANCLWRDGCDTIFDYRSGTLAHLTGYNLDEKISVLLSHIDRMGNGKMALVLSDQVSFGISRMFELMADGKMLGIDICPFYDMHAAETWIRNAQTQTDSSQA